MALRAGRLLLPVCLKLLLRMWAKLKQLEIYPQATFRTIFDDFWAQSYSLWAYVLTIKICSPSLT